MAKTEYDRGYQDAKMHYDRFNLRHEALRLASGFGGSPKEITDRADAYLRFLSASKSPERVPAKRKTQSR